MTSTPPWRSSVSTGNTLAITIVSAAALATVAIYTLQLTPLGVVLMMLGAMLWINFPIHGAMITLALLARSGRIPRAWAIAPVSFYGAGLALFACSYVFAEIHKADVIARNARVRVPVLQPVTIYGGYQQLLRFYDVERIVQNASSDPRSAERDVRWLIQGRVCEGQTGFYYEHRFTPHVLNRIYDRSNPEAQPLCIAQQSIISRHPYPWPGYVLEAQREPSRGAPLINYQETTTTILPVGAATATPAAITDGFASITAPVPLFYAGCALDSSTPAWRCAAGLLKPFNVFYYAGSGRRSGHALYGADREIARILALRPRTTARQTLAPP